MRPEAAGAMALERPTAYAVFLVAGDRSRSGSGDSAMNQHLSSSRNTSPHGDPFSCTLLFRPLVRAGRTFTFPCDSQGRVDLDSMSERARNNYFYARAMRGRELAFPSVTGIAPSR